MYIKGNNRQILTEGIAEKIASRIFTFRSIRELQDQVSQNKITHVDKVNIKKENTISDVIGTVKSNIYIENEYIIIRGIDFNKFLRRVKEYYSENNFSKIFIKTYTDKSEKLWQKGKINRKDMTIKELKFPLFFAMEIAMIFEDLAAFYNANHYNRIARYIRTKTWLVELHKPVEVIPIDKSRLKNIRYTLKPYQEEFIDVYPTLKHRFNLDGYMLSFDQGLGKTLTAISLAECLNVDQVVIVSPNSLKENWAFEIKEYFKKYDNDSLWKEEVFVHGSSKYEYTKKTKYFIINFESIPAIFKYLDRKKSSMIIVDEMHNIRNIHGKRTQELIELKYKLNKPDILLMSGTPIKATPNEITPTLRLIDPLFTEDAAELYNKCFNVDGVGTKDIVNARFGTFMHRKVKSDVLSLPNKNIYKKYFKLDNSNDYLVSTVKKEVNIIFNELYNKELANSGDLMDRYIKLVNKYHNAPKKTYDDYIKYISYSEDNEFTNNSEVFIENMENFVKNYVLPNIKQPMDVKEFKDSETAYLRMKQRALGKAMGQVLHPRRKEMFIQLYEQNKDEIIGMIHNATKKTVIFSTTLDVVKYISDDLSKNGVKNVKIIGETKDRMTLIQDFKNNDEIEVLVATSQTLSTGVTLTEANQMLFFGTPWRSADYDQCCDRIYRIGQNTDVDIYNILLETGDKLNLSTRMNDILEWSDEMFNSMIGDEK